MAKTDEALTIGQIAAARGLRNRAAELFTAAAAYGDVESQVTVALRAAAGLIAIRLAAAAKQDAWAIAEPAVTTLRRAEAWAGGTGLVPLAVEAASACDHRQDARASGGRCRTGTSEKGCSRGDRRVLHGARSAGPRRPTPAASISIETARRLWSEIGRPYEIGRSSEHLGAALSAAGDARPPPRG